VSRKASEHPRAQVIKRSEAELRAEQAELRAKVADCRDSDCVCHHDDWQQLDAVNFLLGEAVMQKLVEESEALGLYERTDGPPPRTRGSQDRSPGGEEES
jgi:hypothetical protein